MKIQQIALQLYTIRDHLKTPPDIAASLKKVRAIGYEAVQVGGLGPIDDAELVRMLKGEGLVCCGTHEGNVLTEPAKVAERLHRLGCAHASYPYPGGVTLNAIEDVTALAKRLNDAGRVLHEAKCVLTYHNHNIEFRRFGGRLMLEVLYAETDPRYLQAELDTYWVQYGGGDPVQWCERLRGRLPLLHVKDFATSAENKPVFAEAGNGNLDWKRILPAAEKSGCKWFIVEQDICPGDAFESVRMSFGFLRGLCARA